MPDRYSDKKERSRDEAISRPNKRQITRKMAKLKKPNSIHALNKI